LRRKICSDALTEPKWQPESIEQNLLVPINKTIKAGRWAAMDWGNELAAMIFRSEHAPAVVDRLDGGRPGQRAGVIGIQVTSASAR
jgi:hypothetical protein